MLGNLWGAINSAPNRSQTTRSNATTERLSPPSYVAQGNNLRTASDSYLSDYLQAGHTTNMLGNQRGAINSAPSRSQSTRSNATTERPPSYVAQDDNINAASDSYLSDYLPRNMEPNDIGVPPTNIHRHQDIGSHGRTLDELPRGDLLPRMSGMFRLLELFSEQGSGGLVDKTIISQDSLSRLVDLILPGSYTSMTKIDFHALDQILLKPVGVYGSMTSLVEFLSDLGTIDSITKAGLLLPPDESGRPIPHLKTGLYFVPDSKSSLAGARGGYLIYWPEHTTWDDDAASSVKRNRVTFMRYLTKLSDQVLALISKSHSEALVWADKKAEAITRSDKKAAASHSRLYTFQVAKSKEQEEEVTMHDGFNIALPPIDVSNDILIPPQVVKGETRQAFIHGVYVPERKIEEKVRRSAVKMSISNQLRDSNIAIYLGDTLTFDAINLLFELGLRERHKPISDNWRRDVAQLRSSQDEALAHSKSEARKSLDADLPRFRAHIKDQLIQHAVGMYPFMRARVPKEYWVDIPAPPHGMMSHKLAMLPIEVFNRGSFGHIPVQEYLDLKARIILASHIVRDRVVSPEEYEALDIAALTGRGYTETIKSHMGVGKGQGPDGGVLGSLVSTARSWTVGDENEAAIQEMLRRGRGRSDPELISILTQPYWSSRLPNSAEELLRLASSWILEKVNAVATPYMHRSSDDQFRANEAGLRASTEAGFRNIIETRIEKLREDVNRLELGRSKSRVWKIHTLIEAKSSRGASRSFNLVETAQFTDPAHILYTVHPASLSSGDTRKLSSDSSFVPCPVIRPNANWSFRVRETSALRLCQLFANGKSLVVIDDGVLGKSEFYLEDDNYLPAAIDGRKIKKLIDLPRVGQDYLLTINEGKRLIAILSRKTHRLFVYDIDQHFQSLQARPEIDLRRWTSGENELSFVIVAFLSGQEEIAIVDDSGLARIFSLVTEQFRPASLKLPFLPSSASSAPDGSALFFIHQASDDCIAYAYHTASFGSNTEGFSFALPSIGWNNGVLTSFGSRSNAHVIVTTDNRLSSKRLHIKTRISEFSFKAQERPQHSAGKESLCNSLIDCHSDVWTRYPVTTTIARSDPAARREVPVIQFITEYPDKPFGDHMKQLIIDFEKTTQKPTEGKLEQIQVSSRNYKGFPPPHDFEITSYPAGKWLVELLCLIPIHLAITSGNRFIPLKDGVTSSDFERSLLGADVMQIASSITLGWYESIFASYMATKSVKVVSSMGEQSVGKSYALNHFVDTSFAGSAMRCTEGAWLSVTPTDDELVVALDFEGIHSIERSAQEDMLLVLLNVSVSNLVLFRNNFALSRDLQGLFSSFQSSTSLINPEHNPSLFRSVLAIIIKDVTDADSDEIVQEFYGKFQRIVAQEQEENFISKLHRGRLDVLPWPVINSAGFYSLMDILKSRLDEQESSHGNASMFLQTLKTLMAKLNASDWGALDQNLASYRAQTLQGLLATTLLSGVTEKDSTDAQLKNLDTDEVIPGGEDSYATLWLSSRDVAEPFARHEALLKLRADWNTDLERQQVPEAKYVIALASHLQNLVRIRVAHVRSWIDANVARFPTEHGEIQALRRQFESMSRELVAGVEVCAMTCAGCNLRCLEGKRHEGEHDCGTSHQCLQLCELDKKEACGFGAGHQGKHVCDVSLHLCGVACASTDKIGCQKSCVKPVGHKDDEHLCGAGLHACGKPCHLSTLKNDGTPLCSLPCTVDCRAPHERHVCENRLHCPAKCALCPRLCATANHGHALLNGAVHLCGQEHPCEKVCASPGICHVSTEPTSVESTFKGLNESFQFTKFTQVAHRLPCIIDIPANKIHHEGDHIHSLKKDPFHFCEARCPHCQYVCELPLGHSNEHSTRHGSMEQTSWAIEGDGDAIREIQGRKFSSGDSGAPQLCQMVCKQLGRHAHIDFCRSLSAVDCTAAGVKHITERMNPNPKRSKDWITHTLWWARSGFKDPYAVEEQEDFAKCDSQCNAEEHKATSDAPAKPSYCTLPIFHVDADPHGPQRPGYISSDGHHFNCKNPAISKTAFNVVFIVDRSLSMRATHCLPLNDTPVTAQLRAAQNNCYGAVLSALYGFLSARETAASHSGAIRRDAYSVILEGPDPETVLDNDFASSADQILLLLLHVCLANGNEPANSIREAERLIVKNWSSERTPVVIFLSDGEWGLPRAEMQSMCRRSKALGKPLSFHSVFFGSRDSSPSALKQMSDIARGEYRGILGRGRDEENPALMCTYTNAIDTIQLSQTFLGFAESMRQARSSLIRS